MAEYKNLLYVDGCISFEEILKKYNEIKKHNKEVYYKELDWVKSKRGVDELAFEFSYKNKLEEEGKEFDAKAFKQEFEKFRAEKRKERVEQFNKEFKKNTELELLFNISDSGVNKETLSYVLEIVKKIKYSDIDYKKVSLQLLGDDFDYREAMPTIMSQEELNMVKYFEKSMVGNRLINKLFLKEGKKATSLTIEEVENANKFVENVAVKIKEMELSPFETAVYVHDLCSSFFYNELDKNYNSRVLGDVISSGNIVCVGYASMYKAIIDRVEDERIKSKLNVCFVSNFSNSGHANNLVYVNDEKYGVCGTYMEDSCWSALGFSPNEKNTLTYCLYPVHDVDFTNKRYLYLNSYKLSEYYETAETLQEADDSDQKLYEKSHIEFLDSIKDKGEVIPFEKYYEAYYNILLKQGYEVKEIEKILKDKMEASIFVARTDFKEGCKNSFYKDVSEEFMKEHETELTRLNKQLKELADKFNSSNDRVEQNILYHQIHEIKKEKRNIIEKQEEKYVPNNKVIISNILKKKK